MVAAICVYFHSGVHLYSRACACVHVARKTRVETYLDRETVEQIEATGEDKSAFIRDAVNDKLQQVDA